MLTLVFTLYQTSVNTFVADVATDLNLDETEPYKLLNFEEMNSITAQAASVSNFSGVYRAATTTADAKWWAADNQSSVNVTIIPPINRIGALIPIRCIIPTIW